MVLKGYSLEFQNWGLIIICSLVSYLGHPLLRASYLTAGYTVSVFSGKQIFDDIEDTLFIFNDSIIRVCLNISTGSLQYLSKY